MDTSSDHITSTSHGLKSSVAYTLRIYANPRMEFLRFNALRLIIVYYHFLVQAVPNAPTWGHNGKIEEVGFPATRSRRALSNVGSQRYLTPYES